MQKPLWRRHGLQQPGSGIRFSFPGVVGQGGAGVNAIVDCTVDHTRISMKKGRVCITLPIDTLLSYYRLSFTYIYWVYTCTNAPVLAQSSNGNESIYVPKQGYPVWCGMNVYRAFLISKT